MHQSSSEDLTNIIPNIQFGSSILVRFLVINTVAIVLGITFVNLVRLTYPKPETFLGNSNETVVLEPVEVAKVNEPAKEQFLDTTTLPDETVSHQPTTDVQIDALINDGNDEQPVLINNEPVVLAGSASLSIKNLFENLDITEVNPANTPETAFVGGTTALNSIQLLVTNIETAAIDEPEQSIVAPTSTANLDNPPTEKDTLPILPKPVRQLKLPAIGMTADIIVAPIVDGDWDISEVDIEVGQLEGFSSHPDENGAIVLAAHATLEWPASGPFKELRTSSLGDPIIYRVDQTEYVYAITRFLRVDIANVNILNKQGEDGIVLVTCGSYNYFTGEYGKRLVAYGELIDVREVIVIDGFE